MRMRLEQQLATINMKFCGKRMMTLFLICLDILDTDKTVTLFFVILQIFVFYIFLMLLNQILVEYKVDPINNNNND